MNGNDIPNFNSDDFAPPYTACNWLYEQYREHGSGVEADLMGKLILTAKTYGITNFKAIYNGVKKDRQKAAGKSAGRNMTQFSGQPIPGGLYCGQFLADDRGILAKNEYGELEIICNHPILPVAKVRNIENGNEKTLLWYKTQDNEQYLLVDSADLGSPKGAISLRQKGIDVDFTTAGDFLKFMKVTCMSQANYPLLPVKSGVSHCGFIGQDFDKFVPYTGDFEYDGSPAQKPLYESIRTPGGSRDEQFTLIDWARRELTPIVRIAIAASLGSVLLKPIGLNPFFLHLWGDKGAGKTLLLMLAASLWANPDNEGKYIRTFNSTAAGSEATASFLNSLPFCLDESMTLADKGRLDEFIYSMCQGGDRTRATRSCEAREARSWRCVFLTTGEKPLTNDTSNGGAIVRVVSINGSGQKFFGEAETAKAVADKLRKNYGWVGREFINIILQPGVLQEANRLYVENLNALTKQGYDDKQSCAAAVCLTADMLASKYVFKNNSPSLTPEHFAKYLETPESSSAGLKTAQWLQGLVATNSSRFLAPREVSSGAAEIWGRTDTHGYTLIAQRILEREMKSAGISLGIHAFAAWARQNNLIEPDLRDKTGKGNFPTQSLAGNSCRVLKIKLEDIDKLDPNYDEPGEYEDALPFN